MFSLFISMNAYGQDFVKYLEDADFQGFSKHLNESVVLQFNREKETVSKAKATELIRQRINRFNPVKWELMHRGVSEQKQGRYVIAKMYNDKEEGMRLFIYLEGKEGNKKISSLRFRKLL